MNPFLFTLRTIAIGVSIYGVLRPDIIRWMEKRKHKIETQNLYHGHIQTWDEYE